MNERLEQLRTRIDAMSLRERVLLFVTLTVLLYLLWQLILLAPLETERKRMLAQIESAQQEIQLLNQQATEAMQRQRSDPNAENRRLRDELNTRLGTLDSGIRDTLQELIAPQQMARVLEEVLTRDTRLKLERIESLGSRPLVTQTAGEEIPAAETAVYRHDLRMVFRGGYLGALDYLQNLRALPWRFYWDEVEVVTEKYPTARITIIVHTFSLNAGWIGV